MTDNVYVNPKKSAFSIEFYDSEPERGFLEFLENNSQVVKWIKNHGIRIPYFNIDGKLAHYNPDFLIEYEDGSQERVEIKGKHLINNPITITKSKAAKEWCEKRGHQIYD